MQIAVDFCQPFTLDHSNIRGRFARLGPTVQTIIGQHSYPSLANHLLGEIIGLAVLLSSALKYEGLFTLQTSSDGPIGMMVVDVDSDGNIRACARVDEDRLSTMIAAEDGGEDALRGQVHKLMGHGHIAFTVDQGGDHERYQGIVSLEGNTLAECAEAYFRQSEQIEASFKLEVHQGEQANDWWVGGLFLQRLPASASGDAATPEEAEKITEDWNRSKILMASATENELVDISLSAHDLIWRLFHDEEPRVFDQTALQFKCRCSRQKIEGALVSYPLEELLDMREPDSGEVAVSCQFCNTRYGFNEADLRALKSGEDA
ncbi:molecular chaperone Hsp33 [Thalassospira sp. MBR-102]|uniref:Heat-shock protein HSP33 n=2 Tax=Thalassospira xiamenensis TaxID=220697 RepID=A0ABR5XZT2_9PROT|nr:MULTISPECIES: Hsp33 family molecular chaperone HslO [Thalassospira]AJD50169.1 heat shock protein HSP33 [Thalassospira xiamenensis M-5 = DSM 17429]KZD01337.1 heat-shock protein HSP33 [Thalassospira xiamenensis]KZD11405.1 heat-shock protein HSP33 [Thalassospira xiamenensis]MAB31764.1 heat-shock protein HSP33 [Thalassospira sp.]MAL27977.1 heat-shock protein HSP33 [Thalassospira sp.]